MTATEKKVAIDSALAKLTEDDKKVLGLIKKPKKKRVKKSYNFTVDYMIGDGNGDTSKKATLKAANPFIPLVTKALDNLKTVKGRWGMVLDSSFIYQNFLDGNISKLEYVLLNLVTGYDVDGEDEDLKFFFKEVGLGETEENIEYLGEFSGSLIEDASYSFLVYEGYTLK
jgi:hypothetical protein